MNHTYNWSIAKRRPSFLVTQMTLRFGNKGTFAMIETVIAVMGLVSAGIFLAHAIEGYARLGRS
jgi:hypothetical protein